MSTGQLSDCAMPPPLQPEDAEVGAAEEVEKGRAEWELAVQEHVAKLR